MFLQFFTCRVVCSSYILPTSKQLFKRFCFFVVFFTFPFFSCAKISGVRVRGGPCVEEEWGYTLLRSSCMRTSFYAT
jgi:hypothetical protein